MSQTALQGKWGVALLNMGGPASLDDVQPFLVELLSDPRVLRLPVGVLRRALARGIASRRAPGARARYAAIGGRSPLLEQTRAQATALEAAFANRGWPVTCAMRYTAPRAGEAVDELIRRGARRLLALPLYPQACESTSGSSVDDFRKAAEAKGVEMLALSDGYPVLPGFIDALVERTDEALRRCHVPHIVYSAHGLPERMAAGDPYQGQVRETVRALQARLPAGLPSTLAYQSRLGPVKWLGPYLDETVRRLGAEGVRELVVVPVSFVSEHIETLHELDIDLAAVATGAGVERFERVPTAGVHAAFIAGLRGLVLERTEASRCGR